MPHLRIFRIQSDGLEGKTGNGFKHPDFFAGGVQVAGGIFLALIGRGVEFGLPRGHFPTGGRRRRFGRIVQLAVGLGPHRIGFQPLLRLGEGRPEVAGFDQFFNFAAPQRKPAAGKPEETGLPFRSHDLRLAQQFASGQKFRFLSDQGSEHRHHQSVVAKLQGTQGLEVGIALGQGEVFFGLHR